MLTADELTRYSRQIVLPELGVAGQERIRAARVLVVGAGGLGSPAALYLAAAGVGTLGLLDDDAVEPSNLHRQVLHGSPDVGRKKVESGADAIARLNPLVRVQHHAERLTAATARSVISGYDVVVDGSDNYATRYAVNDACAALGVSWVYGSVERFAGQVAVFGAGEGPCYRCVFPEAPEPGSTPSCEEIGVLGAVPGVVGSMQAVEALKLIAGIGEPLSGRLLQLDFLSGTTRTIRFDKRPDCAACGSARGKERTMAAEQDDTEDLPFDIEPAEARTRTSHASGSHPVLLLDIREPWEISRAKIAGAELIPMRELQERAAGLDRERDMIVFCHHGSRSRVVTEWLRAQGFRAQNLAGGIDRWSREVDASVPRY